MTNERWQRRVLACDKIQFTQMENGDIEVYFYGDPEPHSVARVDASERQELFEWLRGSSEPGAVGQEPVRPYAWFRIEADEVIFAQGDWPPPEPDDTAWLPLYTAAARCKFDLAFDIMRQMQAENMDTMQSVHFGYVLRAERSAVPDGKCIHCRAEKTTVPKKPECTCTPALDPETNIEYHAKHCNSLRTS